MAVTAAKIGHSPITFDWSGLMTLKPSVEDIIGFQKSWDHLRSRFLKGEIGFFDAPINTNLSQIEESSALARKILEKNKFTDCLFLGIGGSSLGPMSLLSSLKDNCSTRIRFHFQENPDPQDWNYTLAGLNPETTLVCAVTKSGTTFETMAQLLLALEWLGKPRWNTHIVAITDSKAGDLKLFAERFQIPMLAIDPSIGGRFSIFSPVGLFAAALSGLSVTDFLKGAREVREAIEKTPLEKSPFFLIGWDLIRQYKSRPIHVCMPYSTRLRSIGNWFVQLWGESLGKDGKGFTPLAALGATDQHSILQLLRDGPDDKITWFICVDRASNPVAIPKLSRTHGFGSLTGFTQMEGHSLDFLLRTEYQATSLVLTKRSRPHLTIQIDRLDEHSLGALYFSLSFLASITGTLWGINPFDQPGVEEAKVYIRQALQNQPPAEEVDENSPVARLRRHREEN